MAQRSQVFPRTPPLRRMRVRTRRRTCAKKMDAEGDKVRKLKRGLWDNVHAKRKRGEPPAKPGDKGYPDQKQWRKLSGQ